MKREDQGYLSPAEQKHLTPDLLAFLGAHQAYIEIGPTNQPGSGYVMFNKAEGGWEAKSFNGARYEAVDEDCLFYATLPEALEALRDRWMQ